GVQMVGARSQAAPPAEHKRAFSLRTALFFAAIVAAVMFAAALLERAVGVAGALVAAAVGAFADAHAAGASIAALEKGGQLESQLASLGILFALTANAVTKTILAFTSGPRRFAVQIAFGQLLALAAAWAGLALGPVLRL